MPLAARPRVLPKASPESDPRFRKVMEQLHRGAARTRAHPSAAKKAAEASAAAKGPSNEKAAGAKAKQVDKIEEAPAKKPETNSFLALLRAEIQNAMPKNLGETENFMKGGSSAELKGSLKGNVSQKKEEATAGVKTASKEAPPEGGIPTKEAKPIPPEPAPVAPSVSAAEGMPAPKTDAEVSLQDSKRDTDQQMKEAEVTPQQLQNANDPRFSAVLTSKDAVGKQADAAPAQYRAAERGVLAQGAAGATTLAHRGTLAMVGVRGGANSAVLTKQALAKAKEEADRKQVTDHIESIYSRTKASVEQKLNALETEVGSIFDTGIDAALKSMTDYVDARLFRWKLERYLGSPIGLLLWAKDKLKGLPPEVNVIYEAGRSLFTRLMDQLVVRVATLVETRLKEAKAEVARGQAEIKTYVDGLAPNLRAVGLAAQKDVAGRFQELEAGIEEKKNQLAQQLAQKYKEGFDKANESLKKLQDENKGLIDAFVEKLGAVIKALTEFKEKLMAVFKKGKDTIMLILAHPIQFFKNLGAAIKKGIGGFRERFGEHLKKGFLAWLFGALEGAGIEIPSDFSLPSILKLVLGILGITYERMRAKAVKLLGPTAVAIIEKVVEYVKALIQGGPAALWEKVKEDLGNLKEMVMTGIRDWLIETIIKKAVLKLVSMFNPVGAIVQAIMAIYDTVVFIVEKAQQILAFVEAVVNSVSAIASGAIDGAANWIEGALAKAIPLVIGFLAQFLGLGGISKKIKETIEKIQNFVDKAIDKAIGKIVGVVKKLFGKGKEEVKGKEPDADTQKRWDEGMATVRGLAARSQSKPPLKEEIETELSGIKTKHGFKELRLTKSGTKFRVHATMNPETDIDFAASEFSLEELTGESLWIEIARRIHAEELPVGEGVKLSASSLAWNSRVLLDLINKSSQGEASKAAARGTVASNLMQASLSRDERQIYRLVNTAARAVNNLYSEIVAEVPGKQLQAHHRPGVRESSPTFAQTRAGRKRVSVAQRIRNNVANLTREEKAIAARAPNERPALIREYVQQLIEKEVEAKVGRGEGPVEEFDLDVLTSEVHLGQIHRRT